MRESCTRRPYLLACLRSFSILLDWLNKALGIWEVEYYGLRFRNSPGRYRRYIGKGTRSQWQRRGRVFGIEAMRAQQ
jgi:hypothetical protein